MELLSNKVTQGITMQGKQSRNTSNNPCKRSNKPCKTSNQETQGIILVSLVKTP